MFLRRQMPVSQVLPQITASTARRSMVRRASSSAERDWAGQQPLEDAGLLGADKGQGIKLLMLPPNYADKIPDGYVALKPGTFGSYALFRSNLASHGDADVAKSLAYGKRVKLYPLSQASIPQPTVFTDVKDIVFDSTIR
jgi:hypothetical protein